FRGDPGRRARFTDEAAVGLRIFVEAVAAKREECDAGRHLALALVQSAQESTAAIELVAEALVPIIDAVIGYAAQYGLADICGPAILDVVADRIAPARIANQCHAP